jgi:hypothetical protein
VEWVSLPVLALAYRLLHLAGMAVLLGGAFVIAWNGAVGGGEGDAFRHVGRYERLFWVVVAVQVLSGIGMFGLLYGRSPYPGGWGVLMAKLLLVLVLLVLSLFRTAIMASLMREPALGGSRRVQRLVRNSYLLTATVIAVVVALAADLAHG